MIAASQFFEVLVHSGKLSIRIQLSLIDSIRMWGYSMLEMNRNDTMSFPMIPHSVRFKSLCSSWLLVPKLPKTSTSSAGREQPDFQARFELFRDPKHGWVFLIVYANPLASMFLNSRSDAVNSPLSLPLCFLFFPFPFGPIPCRSCAKRRTTDDEKGGILFFLEVKLGYPKFIAFSPWWLGSQPNYLVPWSTKSTLVNTYDTFSTNQPTYCSHMEANPMSLCILCHMISICPHPHWLKERANSTLDVFQRGRDFFGA